MTRRILPLLVLCCLPLAGCPGRFERPADFIDDPQVFLRDLQAHAEHVQSLTGELSLEVWREGDRVRFKQLVAIKQPDRLRIDALSPFGSPVSTLVSDGARISIYDMEEKRFQQGPATPRNLSRLVPVSLEPEELSALLRGTVPVIRHTGARIGWDAKEGRYQLDLEGDERLQRIWFEPEARRPTATEVWRRGRLDYAARLGDYERTDGVALPRRVRVEVPADEMRVDIRVVEHRINPELDDEVFQLEAPRGIPVEPLP